MGTGIDLARAEEPEHAQVLDNFKDQLILVLIKRLAGKNGKVSIPVAEVDATGDCLLMMSIEGGNFNFEMRQKS